MARLGLHTFALAPNWDQERFAARAEDLRRYGVTVIEVPLLQPGRLDCAGLASFAKSHGFKVAPSLGLPAALDVVSDPDPGIAFLKQAFADCRAVGAEALSGVTYGVIGRTSGAPRTDAEWDGTCRFVARAAAAARAEDLRLGLEPCNRYETHILNTAADAVALIERVGTDNLFVHLDTYHMNIEEAGFAEGFAAAGSHLGYVHLSEAHRGVPGTGSIDWDAVFSGLVTTGFDGAMTLESMNHVHPEIAGGLAIWRPVADRPDDVIDLGLPFLRAAAEHANLEIAT